MEFLYFKVLLHEQAFFKLFNVIRNSEVLNEHAQCVQGIMTGAHFAVSELYVTI